MNWLSNKLVYRWILFFTGIIGYTFIIYKISIFNEWDRLSNLIDNQSNVFYKLILLQFILLVLNILTETLKWHILIRQLYNQSFIISLRQVLSGYAIGTFTPARLGEPVGRLIDLPQEYRGHTFALTYTGGFIQTIIITIFGLCGILFLPEKLLIPIKLTSVNVYVILISSAVIIGIYLFVKKNFSHTYRKWIKSSTDYLNSLTYRTWGYITLLTITRYLIFTFQLILFLGFFINYEQIEVLLVLATIYYLLVTVIPSFYLSDLGIRGSVSILIFGLIITNHAIILVSVFLLWVINIGIPTFTGATLNFIYKEKLKTDQSYS